MKTLLAAVALAVLSSSAYAGVTILIGINALANVIFDFEGPVVFQK
jgi:hypothetical protein